MPKHFFKWMVIIAYRTGTWDISKEIYYSAKGRIDFKSNYGHRIELEDIDNNLLRIENPVRPQQFLHWRMEEVKSITSFVVYNRQSKNVLKQLNS